ncbi:MAG TPA: hypothetical protein VF950_21905 [Planctomycetota bacterium]
MRIACVGLALALVACEELPPERTPEQIRVEDAFMAWVNHLAKGNADAAYRGLSEQNKSQWMFDLLRAEDRAAHAWRLTLEGRTRTDVDLWLNYFKDKRDGRVEKLPTALLDDPGVLNVWRSTFEAQKEIIRIQMSRLTISEVFAEAAAASIIVRNIEGKSEMYQMIFERNGWKVDHHRQTVAEVPR